MLNRAKNYYEHDKGRLKKKKKLKEYQKITVRLKSLSLMINEIVFQL